MLYNKLTKEEERVIIYKGTEAPFTGIYYNYDNDGTYTCKRCNAPLFSSNDKFNSGSGWPSFDDTIKDSILEIPDQDGKRTEIVCANCKAHLGHIFKGEGFTNKNQRYCVNSISLSFKNKNTQTNNRAIFAGGCFWGVEYLFQKTEGVLSTKVGYIGGTKKDPIYEEVCFGDTGHIEAVEIIFDTNIIDFKKLCKLFFEIHDPTQENRQGPDIGEQYQSVIFYLDDVQKKISEKLIDILKNKGLDIKTKLIKADTFYIAEEYHQDYYNKTGKYPYCHSYKKRF